jgi:AcrR family transcriptional regulator
MEGAARPNRPRGRAQRYGRDTMASKPKNARAAVLIADEDRADFELVQREVGAGAAQRILSAGLECFSERGYYATTTRDIALRARMSPGAMYVHYPSKGELLYRLSRLGHQDALRAVRHGGRHDRDPQRQLRRRVASLASWHARHHRLARVAQYELRSLPPDRLAEIRLLRQQVTALLESDIEAGVATGAFLPPEAHETVRAILSLCIDIARWYSPRGPRSPTELGEIYADLVIRMITPTSDPSPLTGPSQVPTRR